MKTVLLAIVIIQLLAVATVSAWAAFNSLNGNTGSPPPAPSTYQIPANVGAPPGYGLTDPTVLQPHAPININGNSQWTSANGVRYGAGTLANPYVIESWSISLTSCSSTSWSILIHGNSTVYGIIRNVKIVQTCGYGAITLGTSVYPPQYNSDRADNIVTTHNEIHITNQSGVDASYSTNNNTISYNAIFMNATTGGIPFDGIFCQGGTFYCKVIGNYIDARSAQSCSGSSCTVTTTGVQIGDYNQPTWYRKCAYAVAAFNTITNATTAGFSVDPCYKITVMNNLVYQNYPGRRPTYVRGTLFTDRGILVEGDAGAAGITDWSQVHDNVARNHTNGIEAFSFAGWYWNNTLLNNVGYGIFVETNASGNSWGHWTTYNVFWNNYGSGNGHGLYYVPSSGYNGGGYSTVLDMMGTPTPTSFPISYTDQQGRTITNVTYSWAGTALKVSYQLAANGPYEPAVTISYASTGLSSQNLLGSWWGLNVAVALNRFTTSDILYTIASATSATFQASGLVSAASYEVYRAGNLQGTVPTTIAGELSFGMPAPASGSYEIRLVPSPRPPALTLTAPTNNSYVTTSSVQATWTVSGTGSGPLDTELTLDAGSAINVTGLTTYTLPSLSEGRHVVQVVATEPPGPSTTAWIAFTVDTQRPFVSITNPADNATINTTSVLLTWNATDATSGINHIDLVLDGGGGVPSSGNNYSLAGLAEGHHVVLLIATDNAGLSTTAAVRFTVNTSSSTPGPTASGPAIAAVTYTPDSSAVDIAFTQPMNQTSVATSVAISPNVPYDLHWVSASHVRVVIRQSLVNGAVYQVTLGNAAKDSTGTPLEHPFLFQFLANSPAPISTPESTNWIALVLLIVVLLLTVNWTTAGVLVHHYRSDSKKVRSALGRISKRYQGSLVIVYKRLARSPPHGKKSERGAVAKVPVKSLRQHPDAPVIRYGKPRKSARRK